MTLREELTQSIRDTIVAEILEDLRTELGDKLRDQVREDILEEMDSADENGLKDNVQSAILEEYFEDNQETIIPAVFERAQSTIAKLEDAFNAEIGAAVYEIRGRIRKEITFAAETWRLEMKAELKNLSEELRSEFMALNRDVIRGELQSIMHEVLRGSAEQM